MLYLHGLYIKWSLSEIAKRDENKILTGLKKLLSNKNRELESRNFQII
jgi:hypothetical protein